MILPIVKGKNNPILRATSQVVKKIDRDLKKMLENMHNTLVRANGLGIAAPQVGVNKRVVIVRMNHNTPHQMFVPMINPEIISTSKKNEEKEEGCLSIPGLYGKTMRHVSLTVKFLDKKGNPQILHLDGLNAHIMQHEVDHLNGILFVDHLIEAPSPMPQTAALKKRLGHRKRSD